MALRANLGVKAALESDENLMNGLNVHAGKLTYEAVATAQRREFMPPTEALAG